MGKKIKNRYPSTILQMGTQLTTEIDSILERMDGIEKKANSENYLSEKSKVEFRHLVHTANDQIRKDFVQDILKLDQAVKKDFSDISNEIERIRNVVYSNEADIHSLKKWRAIGLILSGIAIGITGVITWILLSVTYHVTSVIGSGQQITILFP